MKKYSLHSLIKEKRKALKLTQKQLAKAVGVSHVTISQWESGITSPKGMYIGKLSDALNVTVHELTYGSSPNTEPGPDLRGKVPLISWIRAGSWLEMEDGEPEATTYYAHTANVGPRAFALRVKGDSMTSLNGGKSIPEGSVVIVDPDIQAENGKVVVARLDDTSEATLKQLVIDGGQKLLKPFNHTYPVTPVNGNCTVIGVVKQVIQDF
ncbi:LexA family protein [Aliidiomarina maris]|uniref:Phage repressor protein n=1 Tax=Aliidiomarina maris TaxID=531312 RepID=A0A327X3E0_9GAMM|nr:LexA family transcriptional regulator [Aliidiomarina maris]RAK01630.1 phage repressor protein [Aliidiomarina maris]RUO28455.1 transcriptional regulator [Aliidiomarina maris]